MIKCIQAWTAHTRLKDSHVAVTKMTKDLKIISWKNKTLFHNGALRACDAFFFFLFSFGLAINSTLKQRDKMPENITIQAPALVKQSFFSELRGKFVSPFGVPGVFVSHSIHVFRMKETVN